MQGLQCNRTRKSALHLSQVTKVVTKNLKIIFACVTNNQIQQKKLKRIFSYTIAHRLYTTPREQLYKYNFYK